ncbi:hypothetical protein RUM43_001591 [Polyplax serrata]|uniref:G-protein coupled receptors family 1 profile domain-containing protein n=1 Tax=Polyplax serrata TaxID=468196 RepID=A0AAN8SEJ6_POLSC
MGEGVGLLKRTQEIQSKDGEGRGKIQQIKALVNTLYKGTTEKNVKEDGPGREGGGPAEGDTGPGDARGTDVAAGTRGDLSEHNSIRLIFSAIKNELSNISTSRSPGAGVSGTREKLHGNQPLSSVLHHVPTNSTTTGVNATADYEEVPFDDVVLEPLGDNTFLNFLNGSLKQDGPGETTTVTNSSSSSRIASGSGGLSGGNESLGRGFDFFTSPIHEYNAAELLASGAGSNFSSFVDVNSSESVWNQTNLTGVWDIHGNSTWEQSSPMEGNYWALILIIFPFLTLFGNVLVILAVVRERTLQTATNYFIVSLALADLLVAVLVMPFAVYVLVSLTLN